MVPENDEEYKVDLDRTYCRQTSDSSWRIFLANSPMPNHPHILETIQDSRFPALSDKQKITVLRRAYGNLSKKRLLISPAKNTQPLASCVEGNHTMADQSTIENNIFAENGTDTASGCVQEDYTVFHTIIGRNKIRVAAKYDTGADDNFITMEAVKRAKLTKNLKEVNYDSEDATFYMLNNEKVTLKHKIHLEWENCSRPGELYSDTFYVVPESPYAMILGLGFILLERVFVPNENNRTALPLRRKKRPDGAQRTCLFQH